MNLLLDTHTFLWWDGADGRLPDRVKERLSDSRNQILLSVVTAWEIAIKVRRGKLQLPKPPMEYVPLRIRQYGFEVLPVTLSHALETASLPLHHNDPFDRLLAAQSRVEGIPLVTSDADLRKYSIETVW